MHAMWDNLLRVNWSGLTHAYGWAQDMPTILRNMTASDESTRAAGWDTFWGAINHQGDFYDSTVAAIPFLIEAVAHPGTPERDRILSYFRDRWLDAPFYGGDPLVVEPPGGMDIPIPMLTHGKFAVRAEGALGECAERDSEEEIDISSYRRMDLCAWQAGRAIQAGRPTFERLLNEPDREVSAAAAMLLLLWPETRPRAKQALVRAIDDEAEPVEQGRRILEFGVYSAREDVDTLTEWIAPHQPAATQAAAALVWAWVVNPAPLPEPAAAVLRAASAPGSEIFAKLPWAGVYDRGPSVLPANAAQLILRLAGSEDRLLRWRAVQGLEVGRETAKHLSVAEVVPVLVKSLSDDYNRIRASAVLGLSERGESVLEVEPNVVPLLIRALEGHRSPAWGDPALRLDSDASVSGHAARLLATLAHRLTPVQRQEALAGIDRAEYRYAGQNNEFVWFTVGWGFKLPRS
jgi:hypothetical protein